ncbi:uncharacterized protein BCR38DRAFT_417724 [Pseudomassariella vexata]|uniref:Uncharacterized protein n=1 Tax=Pseudomassariella vexata TaxID=1141098 RepID=A0A1Y2EJE3_9PEZI|nr:uncharacterized protein BCR38DRAFT_417724 [Pseudomassariella vexata]ORY71679.1 hypothetical protein BCR38DRAFT_417724 [Pseudomassariella vexata]
MKEQEGPHLSPDLSERFQTNLFPKTLVQVIREGTHDAHTNQPKTDLATAQSAPAEKHKTLTHRITKAMQTTSSTWRSEKSALEARIHALETENTLLRSTHGMFPSSPDRRRSPHDESLSPRRYRKKTEELETKRNPTRWTSPHKGPKTDTMTLTRGKLEQVEQRFTDVTDELKQKKRLCGDLLLQLREIKDADPKAGSSIVDETQVVQQWSRLREMIRLLTLNRFNKPIARKIISNQERNDFQTLSGHWRTYLSTEGLVGYFFRALIWQHLYHGLFHKPGAVWGSRVKDGFHALNDMIQNCERIGTDEYISWRVHTGRVLGNGFHFDAKAVGRVGEGIYDVLTRYATGVDTEALKKAVVAIVELGAQLSAVFARSRIVPLMSNEPGSLLTRGYPFNAKTMDLKGNAGKKQVVDMMITPCLLKRIDDDYSVLIKAEVIC